MKTITDSGQVVFMVSSDSRPSVPRGKVHVKTVQYRVYEYDVGEFDNATFQIHDASTLEAKQLSQLVVDVHFGGY